MAHSQGAPPHTAYSPVLVLGIPVQWCPGSASSRPVPGLIRPASGDRPSDNRMSSPTRSNTVRDSFLPANDLPFSPHHPLTVNRGLQASHPAKFIEFIGSINTDDEMSEIADGDLTHRFSLSLSTLPAPYLDTQPPRQCVYLCHSWHQEHASQGPSEHRILQQAHGTLYYGRTPAGLAAPVTMPASPACRLRCRGSREMHRDYERNPSALNHRQRHRRFP